MKKIFALTMAMLLLFSTAVVAAENDGLLPYETTMSSDGIFEYVPSSGVITAYYGGNTIEVPHILEGIAIKEVGAKAFFDLDLSSVFIGNGIKTINESAFEGSNLFELVIPPSVSYIGDRAFANCSELTTVSLYSENIIFGEKVFENTTYLQFMVPCTMDTGSLREKIIAAKGADNFEFVSIHGNLVESTDETDSQGGSVLYCKDCGFMGSEYVDEANIPFEDVLEESWYTLYVEAVYDSGIMVGKSENLFNPDDGMTCAEAAAIAARIREKQRSEHTLFEPIGDNWYDVYVDYCYRNGIIEDGMNFDWDKEATRAEMAYFFSRCDLSDYYINEVPITDIPDVDENTPYSNEILDVYNKGIAVGSDEYLTYYPEANVKRCEVAAVVARILDRDMRIELPKG